MNQYATYQFYTETFFGGLIGADDFDGYIVKASAFLDGITFGRLTVENITDDVRAAACAVAEEMFRVRTLYDSTGGGSVASEKTGDQSVSYHSGSVVSPASSAAKRSYSAAAEMYIKDKRLLERWCGA
ncbi:MAG: hypothetical protein IIY93_13090 [Clostridia bacterium]|nr:hypothetical protein [Clostridia bacterium]